MSERKYYEERPGQAVLVLFILPVLTFVHVSVGKEAIWLLVVMGLIMLMSAIMFSEIPVRKLLPLLLYLAAIGVGIALSMHLITLNIALILGGFLVMLTGTCLFVPLRKLQPEN